MSGGASSTSFPETASVAKTYADIIAESRVMLQDTREPYRMSEAQLVAFLNRGLTALGRIRPDAFTDRYRANNLNVPEIITGGAPTSAQASLSDEFGLEMQFYDPLIAYIVGVAELTDDEYSQDGRAVALLQQFRNTILGV